jgi:hypothetical protein
MEGKRNKYSYLDRISVEKAVTLNNDNVSTVVEEMSTTLDLYKIRYIKNLRYLLAYTGMSERVYAKRMNTYGLKGVRSMIMHIENGTLRGFDMIHIAALSHEFKLPLQLLLNFNLLDKPTSLLEDYGLYEGMHESDKLRGFKFRRYMSIPHNNAINKRLNDSAIDRASYPKDLFNIHKEFLRYTR